MCIALVSGLLLGPSAAANAEETFFQGRHRLLSFSFIHEGEVVSLQEWPEVTSPHKFTMEIVLRQAGAPGSRQGHRHRKVNGEIGQNYAHWYFTD